MTVIRLLAVTLQTSVDLVGKTLMYVDTRQPVGQGRMSEYVLTYVGGWVVVQLGDAYVVTPVENVRAMVPAVGVSAFVDAVSDPPVSVSSVKNPTPSPKMDPISKVSKVETISETPLEPTSSPAKVAGQPEVYQSRKR